MAIKNTHFPIDTTPHSFVKDKLGVVAEFMKTYNLKTEFQEIYGELKQTDFTDPHLHGFDISKLLFFLKNKVDELELQINTERDIKYIMDLISALPPIQAKPQNVWYIFKKDVEEKQSRPQLSCPFDLDPELEKQIDEELNIKPEYSYNTY